MYLLASCQCHIRKEHQSDCQNRHVHLKRTQSFPCHQLQTDILECKTVDLYTPIKFILLVAIGRQKLDNYHRKFEEHSLNQRLIELQTNPLPGALPIF